ncbi:MAG: hypothetical protein GY941_30450 [Planctomycetes bacterium]|nr:hypothetical protein [Planctomycetota bacterium]
MNDFYLDARDVCLETMKLYLGTCKKYVWVVVVNSPDSRLDSQILPGTQGDNRFGPVLQAT